MDFKWEIPHCTTSKLSLEDNLYVVRRDCKTPSFFIENLCEYAINQLSSNIQVNKLLLMFNLVLYVIM